MRALLTLLVVGVIGFGIVAGMGAVHITTLQATLSEQTKAITQTYGTFVETRLTPLLASNNITTEQRGLIVQLHGVTQALAAGTGSVNARIDGIHDTQTRLVLLLRSLETHQQGTNAPIASQLETLMGKKSEIVTQLDAYNETAQKWNDALSSRTNIIWASLLGAAEKTLPFLRFDGEKEFFTNIQI